MKECFICKELETKKEYKTIYLYTALCIKKGKNGKYRVFAYGENEASIPCNYCPNCGRKLEKVGEE